MIESTLTSREVSEASGAPYTNVRQWRDRNGLLPHLREPASSKWARFSMADALAVCVVHQLTIRGIAAQPAVNLANSLKEFLEVTVSGAGEPFIGVVFPDGSKGDDQRLEFKAFSAMGLVTDTLGFFDSPVIIALNIKAIAWELVSRVLVMRHPPRVAAAQETRRMMLEAAADAIRPKDDDIEQEGSEDSSSGEEHKS